MARRKVDTSDLRKGSKKANAEDDLQQKLTPKMYQAHREILKSWKEFSEECLEEDEPDRLYPLLHMPELENIKIFLRWYSRTSKPILDEVVTTTTLVNKVAALKRAVKAYSSLSFSSAYNNAINTFIHRELPHEESVSTSSYEKPLATMATITDLIEFSLRCDEYQYPHPRWGTQLRFALLIFGYLGSRPGEIIESDGWKGSNEGLLYKDITLSRQCSPDYSGLVMTIRLRNRKGKRLNASHKYVYAI
ncbi:unnamed protein product [Periconia digitata]|uniref:Uncharacterized protein n=1 Tax=Periconia digitata TaxID=1303443 RepID=A0A9W4UKH9_9PLEO|nr:unnamed protein product [Periconia digitata]